eukprot:5737404-Ditylum_brightwellii.AAC.1
MIDIHLDSLVTDDFVPTVSTPISSKLESQMLANPMVDDFSIAESDVEHDREYEDFTLERNE